MSARARAVAIAALGITLPVLLGLAAGYPQIGFTIGLGAMLLSAAPSGSDPTQDPPSPASAVWPALLATITATLISGAAWTDAAMIVLAGVAATISGYSRPLGVAAIRFIIYLVLSVGLLDAAGEHRGSAALIFGCGALWNVAIRMLLARRQIDPEPSSAPARTPTHAQRRVHLRRTLRTLAGWQFPLRLVVGLSVASVVRQLWPTHHYFWIVLTIALLTQRPLERVPTKVLERGGGAVLGVALTWAILFATLPLVALGILICLLGTAAALLRSRSYMLYSTASTPVIMLVLDYGKPIARALLTDRIVATLVAAAIVVALNLIFELLGAEPAKRVKAAVADRPPAA